MKKNQKPLLAQAVSTDSRKKTILHIFHKFIACVALLCNLESIGPENIASGIWGALLISIYAKIAIMIAVQ